LGYDDFAATSVGDFPVKWTTNSSGEVMPIDQYEGKWLNISKQGFYIPQFSKSLPDNFTVEYDLLFLPPSKSEGPNTATVALQIVTMPNTKMEFDNGTDRALFMIDPYMNGVSIANYTKSGEKILENSMQVKNLNRQKVLNYHVSVWRQNSRLRVYLNDAKIIDAASLLSENIKYNALRFQTSLNNDGSNWLISNFKYATGLPDTRNKLIKLGKFSTTGILFDVNSANIKPASYGTLKDIAATIKEAGNIKIKIIGHTDNDGTTAVNLDLSKRRAEAVKQILVSEFEIEESNIQTDGKGAAQPALPNTSAEGKAQNRRVEFIKL
jgi:OmpA-OmpF porin, OOP family